MPKDAEIEKVETPPEYPDSTESASEQLTWSSIHVCGLYYFITNWFMDRLFIDSIGLFACTHEVDHLNNTQCESSIIT